RRRGRVLAAAGARLDARLPPRRPGVAPPPELAAHVLEAANRLRARRGDAGAQMAREVQRAGTRALGGPHLRPRAHAAARLAPGSHLPRRVGQRAIPVAVRAGAKRAGVSAPDARVASADRDAVGDGRTQPGLRTSQGRGAPRGRRPAPPVAQAMLSATRASFPEAPRGIGRLKRVVLTAFLHLVQPLARLGGRLRAGLTPWRRRAKPGRAALWPLTASVWSEQWIPLDQRVRALETRLRSEGACVLRGEE